MVREAEKGVIVRIKPHFVIEILMPMEVNLSLSTPQAKRLFIHGRIYDITIIGLI